MEQEVNGTNIPEVLGHWIVVLPCALDWETISFLGMAIEYETLPVCALVLSGQGRRHTLLKVDCPLSMTSADVLREQIIEIATDRGLADACTSGPLFSVTRDVRIVKTAQSGTPSPTPTTPSGPTVHRQTGAPWHLSRLTRRARLPATNYFDYVYNGSGVVIYHVDTGVLTTHTEFEGRASMLADFVVPPIHTDCNGHGTHTAATAIGKTYGTAKGATLRAIRALGCDGYGYMSGILLSIEEVIDQQVISPHAAVLSLSLVGPTDTTLDNYVATLVNTYNVPVAVAAGNDNRNACLYSPGRSTAVLTVAASTSTDGFASFSNRGTCANIIAPGQDIVSAWHTSNTATRSIQGTSMATPLVAGVLAQLLQAHAPNRNGPWIRNLLMSVTQSSGVVMIDDPYDGYGALPLMYAGYDLPSTPIIQPPPPPTQTSPATMPQPWPSVVFPPSSPTSTVPVVVTPPPPPPVVILPPTTIVVPPSPVAPSPPSPPGGGKWDGPWWQDPTRQPPNHQTDNQNPSLVSAAGHAVMYNYIKLMSWTFSTMGICLAVSLLVVNQHL